MKERHSSSPKLQHLFIGLFSALFSGALSAKLTGADFSLYTAWRGSLLFLPKASLFPAAFFAIYLLEGVAYVLAMCAPCPARRRGSAAYAYYLQLFIAFFFPLLFFSMGALSFAFIWQLLHFFAFLAAVLLFFRCRRISGVLLLPPLGFLIWGIVLSYRIITALP